MLSALVNETHSHQRIASRCRHKGRCCLDGRRKRLIDVTDQVHDVDFSVDGQHLLVISGTVQPKVFSRDGEDE